MRIQSVHFKPDALIRTNPSSKKLHALWRTYPLRVKLITLMERVREKRGPHYDLALVQAAVAARGVTCFTRSALDGLRQMGLTSHEALQVLAALKRRNCYKSMTTHGDYKVWQDVYHAPTSAGMAYVKVTLLDPVAGRVVVSFKPLQGPNE